MNNDFLLGTATAKELYAFAKDLPIIDYHNHLSLADIKEDKRFLDIYELWIKPDPYKHRAMRMCGVKEQFITGDAPTFSKFQKWCETVPKLIGNPLYTWAVMELEAVCGETFSINGQNAEQIFEKCNDYLAKNNVTSKALLQRFNVKYACPCASVVDDISMFGAEETLAPSLRGDDITAPGKEFIATLESFTNIKINCLSDFEKAIALRLDEFQKSGCRYSDHALDNGFEFFDDDGKNPERFKALSDGTITPEEKARLTSYILLFLGKQYSKRGFVLQLHIGAERYTSSALRAEVGPAGGFAGIGNSVNVKSLVKYLDTLDTSEYGLPKTVLFTLNPADNALVSVLSGSFKKEGVSGLITQGPAWWWCDHKQGIDEVLKTVSSYGVLSSFVGMTTDSRSFTSFVRHEYFRRILCDYLGTQYEKGEYFCSLDELKDLVYKLCCGNAQSTLK